MLYSAEPEGGAPGTSSSASITALEPGEAALCSLAVAKVQTAFAE